MKPYISFSEFDQWKRDVNEYYIRYVLGETPPPSKQMRFGSIVHAAAAGESDLETALKEEYFTSDYIRVGKKILSQLNTMPLVEQTFVLKSDRKNGLKCNVLGIFDGIDLKNHVFDEHKTTGSGWRTQLDVDQHKQITLYAMATYYLFGVPFRCNLNRCDSKNGNVKVYKTERSLGDIAALIEEINEMYDALVANGWWGRRIGNDEKMTKAEQNTEKLIKLYGSTS